MMILRPYQKDALAQVLAYMGTYPTGRLLMVLPPGSGKTLIAVMILLASVRQGLRGLVIGHRREIVVQHYNHLVKNGLDESLLGIIMSCDSREAPQAPIQVASIQTLTRRSKPPANIVITDEAHRDAAKSRRKLRKLYPDSFKLGLTATPHRLDGRGLANDFDDMLVISSMSELLAEGYLKAPRVFTVPDELLPDLTEVRVVAGEYTELDRVINQRVLVGGVIDHWQRLSEGRRTVCFASSIDHSKHIVDRFHGAGVAAAHLDQSTSLQRRSEILSALKKGGLRLVSCVNILAEGWDCPEVKCVIQARPTMSLNLHIQQTGRCMRPWNGRTPLILDHAGNMATHGLPQMDREWSLDWGCQKEGGKALVKTCGCGAIVALTAGACPECGAQFPKQDRVLEEKAGTLREYELKAAEKKAELEHIRRFAERKGFDERWVQQVFHAKFGMSQVAKILRELGVESGEPNPFT